MTERKPYGMTDGTTLREESLWERFKTISWRGRSQTGTIIGDIPGVRLTCPTGGVESTQEYKLVRLDNGDVCGIHETRLIKTK